MTKPADPKASEISIAFAKTWPRKLSREEVAALDDAVSAALSGDLDALSDVLRQHLLELGLTPEEIKQGIDAALQRETKTDD